MLHLLCILVLLFPFVAQAATQVKESGTSKGYINVLDFVGSTVSVSGITGTVTTSAGSGTVTSVATSAPLTGGTFTTSGTIGIGTAGVASDGYLTSVDWNTFNNKQASGSYLTSVTADAPLSGSGTAGSHLVLSTAGTWSGLAGTASALAANGGNCSGNNFALGVDASGVGECAQPAFSNFSGSATDAQVPNDITITETDPQVGTLTNTKWCTTDGTDIDCTSDAPGGSESTTVSDTTTVDLVLTGSDITANGLYTAGDALTLTGADIDFDGGVSPSGDLGGTWASPSVNDDSHAHTTTTISGILAADMGNADHGQVSWTASVATVEDMTCTDCINDTEISTNAGTALSADLEEEVTEGSLANDTIVEADLKIVDAGNDEDILTRETTTGDFEWHSGSELCVAITGSADLCDGVDSGGAGGGVSLGLVVASVAGMNLR